jgi:hypothetical protein
MTIIVTPKNKEQEKVLTAFLTSLKIGFHSEKDEDKALHAAIQKGRKTALLSPKEKAAFLNTLKNSK